MLSVNFVLQDIFQKSYYVLRQTSIGEKKYKNTSFLLCHMHSSICIVYVVFSFQIYSIEYYAKKYYIFVKWTNLII